MPSSDTEICNLALAHLGEARITSREENSAAGRACDLHYLAVRDEVLRAHRWNFAQARVKLSALTAPPAFGWSYQYELPPDCLRVLEVNGSEYGDALSDEYIVEGRRLLTDAAELRLVYIKQVEHVNVFDALFVDALALKLAIKLSETLRGTTQRTGELLQAYERITAPLARRVDANEGRRRKGLLPMNSLSIRARMEAAGSDLDGGRAIRVLVPAPPQLLSPKVWTFYTDEPADFTIEVANTPVTFALSALPAGLVLNAATGRITGLATVPVTLGARLALTNEGGTTEVNILFRIF